MNYQVIPSLNGRYAVTVDGDVYSLVTAPRKLRPARRNDGYLMVSGYLGDGRRKLVCVHRLVAEVFLEPDESRPFVNHKNGVKTDNRAANLEWVTAGENVRHAVRTGLLSMPRKYGESHRSRAASLRASGATYQAVADEIGCSIAIAYELCSG